MVAGRYFLVPLRRGYTLRRAPEGREAGDVPILNDAQLSDALPYIRDAPATAGTLELIVARPSVGERSLLAEGVVDLSCRPHRRLMVKARRAPAFDAARSPTAAHCHQLAVFPSHRRR